MNILTEKLKENLSAVAPVFAIVLGLHFTAVPLETSLLAGFLAGSALIVLGLTFFLIGVDIGITPLGSRIGVALAKSDRLWLVLAAGVALGFFISVAEPGLMVLSNQVGAVTSGRLSGLTILVIVSAGLAVFLAIGFARIFYGFPLYKALIVIYAGIAVLAAFTSPMFLGIAFDASGATTGILAVPFILALAVGISALKKGRDASEQDSFGLIAVASAGAIIAVMVLSLFMRGVPFNAAAQAETAAAGGGLWRVFTGLLPGLLWEGFITLLPLIVILAVFQRVSFKMPRKAFRKMIAGFLYAYIGLVLFFLGVNGGFMEVGGRLGSRLAAMDVRAYVVAIGFVIGFTTILAEPAVHVLTRQIVSVTSGYVKKKDVLISLCVGVGLAVALSVARIVVPAVQLWHYLLPGYILALGMTLVTPKLFVGIAFDAGGVATGPMTATFILAFTQGAASAFEGANVLVDGFGMIAMVSLMPIITLQTLGIIFKLKSKGVYQHEPS